MRLAVINVLAMMLSRMISSSSTLALLYARTTIIVYLVSYESTKVDYFRIR